MDLGLPDIGGDVLPDDAQKLAEGEFPRVVGHTEERLVLHDLDTGETVGVLAKLSPSQVVRRDDTPPPGHYREPGISLTAPAGRRCGRGPSKQRKCRLTDPRRFLSSAAGSATARGEYRWDYSVSA